MKKLKEKIDNNEYIVFIKKTWSNKKTRAWIGLGIYFIFFLILGILMRIPPKEKVSLENNEQSYSVEDIVLDLDNKSKMDYNYKLYIQNEELIGSVIGGTNSFIYSENKYVFIYDKLYLSNETNLELTNNFLNYDIPIEYININNIIKNIKNKSYRADSSISNNFSISYDVSTLKFMNRTDDNNLKITLVGTNRVVKYINIIYNDSVYKLEIL